MKSKVWTNPDLFASKHLGLVLPELCTEIMSVINKHILLHILGIILLEMELIGTLTDITRLPDVLTMSLTLPVTDLVPLKLKMFW